MLAGDNIKILRQLVSILIDPSIPDEELRPAIH